MDVSRVSTCSIALIHHPPEKAFEIIATAGYKKVDLLERLPHLSLLPNECDPAPLKSCCRDARLADCESGYVCRRRPRRPSRSVEVSRLGGPQARKIHSLWFLQR